MAPPSFGCTNNFATERSAQTNPMMMNLNNTESTLKVPIRQLYPSNVIS